MKPGKKLGGNFGIWPREGAGSVERSASVHVYICKERTVVAKQESFQFEQEVWQKVGEGKKCEFDSVIKTREKKIQNI